MAGYIHYYRRSNYGSEHIYLANLTLARVVAVLTQKKTVTALDLATLEILTGEEVVEVPAPSRSNRRDKDGILAALDEEPVILVADQIAARAREIGTLQGAHIA